MGRCEWKAVLDYIEEHINEKITLEDVARTAGYSPTYFSKLFKKQMGLPVTEYIRKRKLQYSVRELAEGKKVLDVALMYGFDTHEGFARSFYEMFGSAPGEVRKYIAAHGMKPEWVPEELEKKLGGNLDQFSKILLFPYSHHDHAYMCTRSWHKRRYVKIFCEVLDIMKEDPDYTWHIDNILHSWEPFARYCPERVEKFISYVKKGRICVLNGGVALLRPCRGYEETFLRNMIEGKRRLEQIFGLEQIPVFYNADTGCGHSQLPQILRLCGHRYYGFMRPDTFLTKKGVPMQFWWEGLDGSRVLTARGRYFGFGSRTEWLKMDPETAWEEKKEQYLKNEMYDKLNHCEWSDLLFAMTGWDDSRPKRDFNDGPVELDGFIREWNAREKSRMRYGNFEEACRLLEQRTLPVWKGALDHGELGYMRPLRGADSQNRRLHELDGLLVEVEKLAVIAETLGFPYPEERIRQLWEGLFQIGGHAIEVIQKRDWEELKEIADLTLNGAKVLRRQIRDFIVNQVRAGEGQRIVVINTLNWESWQSVRFQVTEYDGLTGFDLVDARGERVLYQITDYFEDHRKYPDEEVRGVEIEAMVRVPAMGYTVLHTVPNGGKLRDKIQADLISQLCCDSRAEAPDRVELDNGQLRVTFEKGRMTAVVELKSGKGIRAEEEKSAVQLKFDVLKPSDTDMMNPQQILGTWEFLPEGGTLLEKGPVRQVYKAWGTIRGEKAAIIYSLTANSRGMDIRLETDFVKNVEGQLWFCVPVDENSPVYADIPYGAEKRVYYEELSRDPETGEQVCDRPEWEWPGQTYGRSWCNFSSGGASVALVSRTNHWRYNYDREKGEMKLMISSHWDMSHRKMRCFAQCGESFGALGSQFYELSLFFSEKQGAFTDIQHFGRQRIHPAFADQQMCFAGGEQEESGRGAETCSLLTVDQKNILCTAVYKEQEKYLARFFECEGEKTETRIRLPQGAACVRSVDLEGKALSDAALDPEGEEIRVSFGPFQILTLEWER